MKRFLGSMLIAAGSSLMTLLLVWTTQPSPFAANANVSGEVVAPAVADQSAVSDSDSAEVLMQLTMLGGPEQDGRRSASTPMQSSGSSRIGGTTQTIPSNPSRNRTSPKSGGAAPKSNIAPGHEVPATDTEASTLQFSEVGERCVEVARDIDAGLGKRLTDIRLKDPNEFDRVIRLGGRKLMALAELKQRDPALYGAKLSDLKMEMNVRAKARELRRVRMDGSADEIANTEKQLRIMLTSQLLLSIKSRGEYLCRLQEQIDSLKGELEHQATHFNEIVETRVRDLAATPEPPASVPPEAQP